MRHGSLQLIQGVVSNLQVAERYEEFVFTTTDKSMIEGAAAGAALIGDIFNSSMLIRGAMDTEITMQYFTCKLGERQVAGRFYHLGFKNGDEIEMVVNGKNAVFSARNPTTRTIWMLPHHSKGIIAQQRYDKKSALVNSFLIYPTCLAIFFLILGLYKTGLHLEKSIFIMMALPFILLPIIAYPIEISASKKISDFSVQATPIIEALGYDNASEIDLDEIDKAACKTLSKEAGILVFSQPWVFRY